MAFFEVSPKPSGATETFRKLVLKLRGKKNEVILDNLQQQSMFKQETFWQKDICCQNAKNRLNPINWDFSTGILTTFCHLWPTDTGLRLTKAIGKLYPLKNERKWHLLASFFACPCCFPRQSKLPLWDNRRSPIQLTTYRETQESKMLNIQDL